jgi:hypothetical protein
MTSAIYGSTTITYASRWNWVIAYVWKVMRQPRMTNEVQESSEVNCSWRRKWSIRT